MTAETDTFVPLMKKSKGFDELNRLVIEQGICSGCSTCAAFCERITIDENGQAKLADDAECNINIGAVKCSDLGTCIDVCPMVSFSKSELEKAFYGEERKDADLGHYRKIVAAKSKKKSILEKAQDEVAAQHAVFRHHAEGLYDA